MGFFVLINEVNIFLRALSQVNSSFLSQIPYKSAAQIYRSSPKFWFCATGCLGINCIEMQKNVFSHQKKGV